MKDGTSNETEKFNFKRGKYDRMARSLERVDWSNLVGMGVEDAWSFIKEEIVLSIRLHVPRMKKQNKHRRSVPWWSPELKREVQAKEKAWMKYSQSKLPEDYKAYTIQRNITTKKLRLARLKYEESIIVNLKEEPKKLYRYVRSQRQVKAAVGSLENEEGNLTETSEETAEVLQIFFQAVFVKEEHDILPDFPNQVTEDEALRNIILNKEDIIIHLSNLKTDKAAGPDGIPSII